MSNAFHTFNGETGVRLQSTDVWMDVSVPITDALPVWPGDPPVGCCAALHLDNGDPATVSRLDMGVHTGTHVDSPAHFIRGGTSLEEMPLEGWLGNAYVVSVPHDISLVDAHWLESKANLPDTVTRVLFKTKNSSSRWYQQPFNTEFVALSPCGAQWLVDRGIRLVAMDYLSVEAYGSEGAPTHMCLLGAGVYILEGLYLQHAPEGWVELCCLPLRLAFSHTGDGAPARAVIRPIS